MGIWYSGHTGSGDGHIPHWSAHSWFQLHANAYMRVNSDGTSTWVPATHMGDPDWVPSSWFQPGPDLAVVSIWGVSQQIRDFFLTPPKINNMFLKRYNSRYFLNGYTIKKKKKDLKSKKWWCLRCRDCTVEDNMEIPQKAEYRPTI